MRVIFQSKYKNQNRYVIDPIEGYGKIYFDPVFITSDKNLIRKLINHPLKKRGDYFMVTNDELVAKYLDGDDPEKLTREVLNTITMEGIVELGKVYKTQERQPVLIKEELIGYPIYEKAEEIINFYRKNKKSFEDVKEEVKEKKVDTVESSTVESLDMSAKDAVDYINENDVSELKGFLSKEDTRKTIENAWKEKFS
jgi:hypothetical protein